VKRDQIWELEDTCTGLCRCPASVSTPAGAALLPGTRERLRIGTRLDDKGFRDLLGRIVERKIKIDQWSYCEEEKGRPPAEGITRRIDSFAALNSFFDDPNDDPRPVLGWDCVERVARPGHPDDGLFVLGMPEDFPDDAGTGRG
jgi:hypothetical protein